MPRTDWHKRFLDALERSGGVDTACRAAGVTRSTAYDHRRRFPAFARAWGYARDALADDVECVLFELAMAGDVRAGIFLLRYNRPEVYGRERPPSPCVPGEIRTLSAADQEAEIVEILARGRA